MIALQHPELSIIYPVHLNPNVQKQCTSCCQTPPASIIPPLGYQDFIRLMDRCHLILTDSGGIREAPSLSKPTLVMRDCTERRKESGGGCKTRRYQSRDHHWRVSVLLDDTAYTTMSQASNPYGDGKAAERIAQILGGHWANLKQRDRFGWWHVFGASILDRGLDSSSHGYCLDTSDQSLGSTPLLLPS